MKYLKKFETLAGFQAVSYTLDTPNVSLIEANMGLNYLPIEKRVICKYNVTSTSDPTSLWSGYEQNIFKSMEIDGVQLNNIVTSYTFDTIGIHIVKYELYDETKLGNNAPVFNNNHSLIEAIIPHGVITISTNAFTYLQNIENIIIPNSVTTIGNSALSACHKLTNINISSNVISIGGGAFSSDSSLMNIIVDNNNANYSSDNGVLFNKSKTLLIKYPQGNSRTSYNIPNGVTHIESAAFNNCVNLTNITIPSSITNIGNSVFRWCSNLNNIKIEATIPPTLFNENAFDDTNNCLIYVPLESVETYKSTSGWGNYASRIQAIPS